MEAGRGEKFAQPEVIYRILTGCRKIAVVGLSDDITRPSFDVANYLLNKGYSIFPVNPGIQGWVGLKSYTSLEAIPEPIEVVDVFRKPEMVPEIVASAVKISARAVWMQEGVINPEAAEKAAAAGMLVVMDRCMKKEHQKLFG